MPRKQRNLSFWFISTIFQNLSNISNILKNGLAPLQTFEPWIFEPVVEKFMVENFFNEKSWVKKSGIEMYYHPVTVGIP